MRREFAGMILASPVALESLATTLLRAGGFSEEESVLTAKSLILSNLMGHDSHGVVRVRQYIEELKAGTLRSGVPLKILNETTNSIHANAQGGLGQVQMPRLLDMLFSRIEKCASVTCVVTNCGHVGRLGEWVELAAAKSFAAFIAVNDNGTYQIVAPAGGIDARTSTNPIAFAIPLKNNNFFSIDLSTSATAAGKMRLAHISGETIADGLIQDHQGMPSNDPACLFNDPKGSILPFGGYKGFALSMMLDCLVSGLSGGFTPPAPPHATTTNNVLLTIWNPAYFAGLEHMQIEAEKYLDHVRDTRPINAHAPVRVPGDRAKKEKEERLKNGIPLEPNFHEAFIRYAEKLGITVPDELKL